MKNANPIDLVCREIVELVTAYLIRALRAEERARFEKHILTCPPCTLYLAQMRATVDLAGEIGKAAAGSGGDGEGEADQRALVGLFRKWRS
jgi:anti-sigma factor RsiW